MRSRNVRGINRIYILISLCTYESFLFRNLVPLTCGQMKATERERGCKQTKEKRSCWQETNEKAGQMYPLEKTLCVRSRFLRDQNSYLDRDPLISSSFSLIFFIIREICHGTPSKSACVDVTRIRVPEVRVWSANSAEWWPDFAAAYRTLVPLSIIESFNNRQLANENESTIIHDKIFTLSILIFSFSLVFAALLLSYTSCQPVGE